MQHVCVIPTVLAFSTAVLAYPESSDGYRGVSYFGILWLAGPPLILAVLLLFGAAMVRRASRFFHKRFGRYDSWMVGIGNIAPPCTFQAISGFDRNFSDVLFIEFLHQLYAKTQTARGKKELQKLSAYLSQSAIANLAKRNATKKVEQVSDIVVCDVRLIHVSGTRPSARNTKLGVEFEACYNETSASGAVNEQHVRERWFLVRAQSAASCESGTTEIPACPRCRSNDNVVTDGRCSQCNMPVGNGMFDWFVTTIHFIGNAPLGPNLTSPVDSIAASEPATIDSCCSAVLDAIGAKDSSFRLNAFVSRVLMIYLEYVRAWNARNLSSVRPFLTVCLYRTQSFWVEAYRRRGLTNIIELSESPHIVVQKASSDRFYDSITVHICSKRTDYTLSDDRRRVVSGSTSKVRSSSEKWTFIRCTDRRCVARSDRRCPNCELEIDLNNAGECRNCRASIVSGKLDWVLNSIKRD